MIPYYLMLCVFCILWALKEVLVKIFLDTVPPVQLTFYLSLFSTIYAFILLRIKKRKITSYFSFSRVNLQIIIQLFLLSLTTAIGFVALVFAIDIGGPILFSLVDSSTYSVFVAIVSYVILKESFPVSRVYGLAIAVLGILIFQFSDIRNLTFELNWGFPLAVLNTFVFAIGVIFIKRLLSRKVTPEEILFCRFIVLDICLFLFLAYKGELFINPIVALKVAFLALIGYAGPFYMLFYSFKKVSANLFSVFVLSIPVLSYIFTLILIPDTVLLSSQIIGGMIVIIGMIVGISSSLLGRSSENSE